MKRDIAFPGASAFQPGLRAGRGGRGRLGLRLLERVEDGPADGDHRHGEERAADAEQLRADDDGGQRDDRCRLTVCW